MLERILVTGSNGGLGSNLARKLLEKAETVRALIAPNDLRPEHGDMFRRPAGGGIAMCPRKHGAFFDRARIPD